MVPERYNLETLSFALRNASVFTGEFSRNIQKINQIYYRKLYNNDGFFVGQEDWDNLIILDGCRADTYREYALDGGKLKTKQSRASESSTFLAENFAGRDFTDTVYVTANPYVNELKSDIFHDVINLLEEDWSEKYQTVLPETVMERTVEARYEYPHKRVISHFMQPHYPFIGETGQKISHTGISTVSEEQTVEPRHIWKRLQYGLENVKLVRQAYRENLDIVTDIVGDLLKKIDGRTVVTADHGNLFGERTSPIPVRGYGHPKYLLVPELVKVPWHVFDSSKRPEIIAEPSQRSNTINSNVVQERLAHLGYR